MRNISSNFYLEIDNNIGNGTFLTSQVTSNSLAKVSMSSNTIINSLNGHPTNFKIMIIALYHEIIHVKQRTELNMTNHERREFLAYYYSLGIEIK